MLRRFNALGVVSSLLCCASATAFGQSGVAITGAATVCGSGKYDMANAVTIGPLEAQGVPCQGNSSTATVTGSASVGLPHNKTSVVAQTTGDVGNSSGSSTWADTVTFTPPAGSTDEIAAFRFHDSYKVDVHGPISTGQTPADYCYEILSSRLNECAPEHGDIDAQTIEVHRQFSLEKLSSGDFKTTVTVTVAAGANTGGEFALVAEPVGSEGVYFTCPTTGWVYTLASTQKTTFVCQMSAE
jgi:hypothetical protein